MKKKKEKKRKRNICKRHVKNEQVCYLAIDGRKIYKKIFNQIYSSLYLFQQYSEKSHVDQHFDAMTI